MKVKYVGPDPEVQIAVTGQSVKQGESVEVDAAVARELVKQDIWKKMETTKKKET